MAYLKPKACKLALKWAAFFTAILPFLLFSNTAQAEKEWCVQELEKKNDRVVVLHNPECDLRQLTRLYPQRDEAGNVLPTQVQLRSIYAANQSRVVDGEKIRYTVMRGCVSPGKPSLHADAEELAACPNGLMNYFSAPSSDNAARIEVPFTRKLTLAEQNLKLAKDACEELQSKEVFSEEGKKAAGACKKQFPEMAFDGSVEKSTPERSPEEQLAAKKRVAELEAEVSKLRNEKPQVKFESKQNSVLLFGIFVLIAAFCAVLTILLIKKSRVAKELKESNRAMFKERKTFQHEAYVKARREVLESNQVELAEHKAQAEKDLADAWNKLLAKQQRQINDLESEKKELESRINDYRDSVLPPSFANEGKDREVKQLQIIDEQAAKIRQLKNENGGLQQQNQELLNESAALVQRSAVLEQEAVQAQALLKQVRQEKTMLELRIGEAASKLTERNAEKAKLEHALMIAERECSGLNKERAEQANKIQALERRLEALLEAQKLQSNFPGRASNGLKQTIPFGALDAEKTKKIRGAIDRLEDGEAALHPTNRGDSLVSDNRYDALDLVARGEHGSEAAGGGRQIEGSENEINIPSLDPPRIPLDLDPDEEGFRAVQKWDYNAENFWYSLATLIAEMLRLPNSVFASRDSQTIIAAFTEKVDELSVARSALPAKQSHEYAISEDDEDTLVAREPDEMRKLLNSEVCAVQATEEIVLKRSAMLVSALDLENADRKLTREVVGRLSEEQLMLLANAVFYAISEKIKKSGQLEYPVTGTSDLFALHNVLVLPITSDYGFQMPEILHTMSGHGVPRVYHAMHDAFGSFSVGKRPNTIKHNPTMRPPAGVPHDQNSTPPMDADHSQVKTRAAICPPPGEESGGSSSASS